MLSFDLNVPVPNIFQPSGAASKKGKGKQQASASAVVFTTSQISALEVRVDLLVRCEFRVPDVGLISLTFFK